MKTLKKLKEEAKAAAQFRGHTMGNFGTLVPGKSAEAVCQICGAAAWVDRDPAPNGIDIAGPAVAQNCQARWRLNGEI
jgi:hypothetical protein